MRVLSHKQQKSIRSVRSKMSSYNNLTYDQFSFLTLSLAIIISYYVIFHEAKRFHEIHLEKIISPRLRGLGSSNCVLLRVTTAATKLKKNF